jgi:hypothetical protein
MINIDIDIRNLSKWLNEEQLGEIDRQALARVLGFAYLADIDKKAIIKNYPEKDNLQREPIDWAAYEYDGIHRK